MNDFAGRFRATGADAASYPKFARLMAAAEDGLALSDVLFGISYAVGIETALGEEWRRFTDGVDRQFSADFAEFALGNTERSADVCFLHCQWGVSVGQLGRREETIAVYEKLVATLEGDDSTFARDWTAWAYNGIGWSNFILDRGEPAVEAATKALAHDENNNSWRHTLASGLYVAGKHDEAFEQFDQLMTNGFTCHAHPALAADERFVALAAKHGAEFKALNRGAADE